MKSKSTHLTKIHLTKPISKNCLYSMTELLETLSREQLRHHARNNGIHVGKDKTNTIQNIINSDIPIRLQINIEDLPLFST